MKLGYFVVIKKLFNSLILRGNQTLDIITQILGRGENN